MQNQKSVQANYQKYKVKEQSSLTKVSKQIFRISILRLLAFLSMIIVPYLLFKQDSNYTIYAFFGTLIIFLVLVKIHSRFFASKRLIKNRLRIIEEELKALDGNQSAFDNGKQYMHRSKAYAFDLDIFGPYSLYQKFNRTTTLGGSGMLANWFNFSEQNIAKIREKQKAVKELAQAFDVRLNFRSQGLMLKEEPGEYRALIRWMNQQDLFFGKPIFIILIWCASIINISTTSLYFMHFISGNIPAFSLLLSLLIVGIFTKKINHIHQEVSSKVKLLNKYMKLIEIIEQTEFKASYFHQLQNELGFNKRTASIQIKKLSKILSALDTRLNIIAGVFVNSIFLWDILQVYRMEKWKSENKSDLLIWFTALAKFDALNSLSTITYNHPSWIFPEISERDFEFIFQDLKHPLMQDQDCVGNDFSISQRPYITVVTGANMAGKSTFLRSLGTNMLLAMMGAPVSAKSLKLNPIEIISSIRTRDSLAKNESYFYAEIKRLEVIINRLKKGDRLFVFLDEILKGTNSKDKEQGSKALLKQLIELKAVGVIATHDLNLGIISQDFKSYVENQCFEVEIQDGGLYFDYKIRPGIAQNLSATYLMKQMGMTI